MAKEEAVDKLKDVPEVEDDFFEKMLNDDDIVVPTDDDEEDSGADAKKVEKVVDDKEEKKDEETVESLKAKIAEMEKERKGQLSDVVKSRQERQMFKSELNDLKSAVALILEKRANNSADEEVEKKPPFSDTRRAVEFGDDDKAYVDLSEVKDAISAETAKTKAELEELKQQRAVEEAQKAYANNVQSIISEDKEVYPKAYDMLKDIYKAFNEKIIELQQRTGELGEDGVLNQDYALDLFSGSPEEKEWNEMHPGIDPTRVARAFNTKTDLRVGLKHIATSKGITGEKKDDVDDKATLDSKIKEAKKKPGSLAGQENRTGDTSDLIERIASMTSDDILGFSDAEAARIEQMLLREELKGD